MPTQITFIGHSTFDVRVDQASVLIDPFLTDNPVTSVSVESVSPDWIVLTHGHFDHVADAVEVARISGATVIANFEICEWATAQGVENVHAMHIGGSYAFPFGTVKLTIAHHGSMLPDGSNGGNPCGALLKLNDGTIYHAGDTGLFSDMQLIGEEGIDVAILPIGDNFTMGPDDSVRATKLIAPKRVIPCHYNTWPLIEQDDAAWSARIREETGAEPVVLKPGDSCTPS